MGVHRTREQKLQTEHRREMKYVWKDGGSSAPVRHSPSAESTQKNPSDMTLVWLRRDMQRTLLASAIIVVLLAITWMYLH